MAHHLFEVRYILLSIQAMIYLRQMSLGLDARQKVLQKMLSLDAAALCAQLLLVLSDEKQSDELLFDVTASDAAQSVLDLIQLVCFSARRCI